MLLHTPGLLTWDEKLRCSVPQLFTLTEAPHWPALHASIKAVQQNIYVGQRLGCHGYSVVHKHKCRSCARLATLLREPRGLRQRAIAFGV